MRKKIIEVVQEVILGLILMGMLILGTAWVTFSFQVLRRVWG